MSNSSFQSGIPKARISLKLDLHTGGASKKTELPLKLLVAGYFSHGRETAPLSERWKVSVNKNNFDAVISNYAPGISLVVKNTLTGDSGQESIFDIQTAYNGVRRSVATRDYNYSEALKPQDNTESIFSKKEITFGKAYHTSNPSPELTMFPEHNRVIKKYLVANRELIPVENKRKAILAIINNAGAIYDLVKITIDTAFTKSFKIFQGVEARTFECL